MHKSSAYTLTGLLVYSSAWRLAAAHQLTNNFCCKSCQTHQQQQTDLIHSWMIRPATAAAMTFNIAYLLHQINGCLANAQECSRDLAAYPMGVQEMQAPHNVQCNGCAFIVPLELAIRAIGESMTQVSALQGPAKVGHHSTTLLMLAEMHASYSQQY